MADDQKRLPRQESTINFCLLIPRDIRHVESGGVDAQLRIGQFTDLRQQAPMSVHLDTSDELC
jgi:hypothetical protein